MKRSPVLAAMGLVLSACGSLDPNTSGVPALTTLSGSLSNPDSLSVAGSVRVAVVWKYINPGEFSVAEDLPVQPVFPSAFVIELDRPPPAEALNLIVPNTTQGQQPTASATSGGGGGSAGSTPLQDDGGLAAFGPNIDGGAVPMPSPPPVNMTASSGTGIRLAVGAVVAYEDLNGNGKLDLVPEDASAFVDKIVASDPDMVIAYVEGPITSGPGAFLDSAGHPPKEGYNLVYVRHCPEVAPSSGFSGFSGSNPACSSPPPAQDAGPPAPPAPDAGRCGQDFHWLPMSTPYPLTVASTPEVAALMCQTGGASAPSSTTGSGGGPPLDPSVQPAKYPDPCDPNLSCAPDGSEYTLISCVTMSQGVCEGTITSCTSIAYTRPTPVPAGWPCIH
jgi:hypothetical protein